MGLSSYKRKDTIQTLRKRIVGDSVQRQKDLAKLLRKVREEERVKGYAAGQKDQ